MERERSVDVTALVFRQAGFDDVAALARLRAEVWGTEEYWRKRIGEYTRCETHPRDALDARTVVVAQLDTAVIGFVAGHLTTRFGCDGELQWIDVAGDVRRRGTGAALLKCLAEWFALHGARRVCVDVDPGNVAARSLYRKHGAVDLNAHWLVWPDICACLLEGPAPRSRI